MTRKPCRNSRWVGKPRKFTVKTDDGVEHEIIEREFELLPKPRITIGGFLLQFLIFLVLLPIVVLMPPMVFFLFAWVAWTAHYLRKGQ